MQEHGPFGEGATERRLRHERRGLRTEPVLRSEMRTGRPMTLPRVRFRRVLLLVRSARLVLQKATHRQGEPRLRDKEGVGAIRLCASVIYMCNGLLTQVTAQVTALASGPGAWEVARLGRA